MAGELPLVEYMILPQCLLVNMYLPGPAKPGLPVPSSEGVEPSEIQLLLGTPSITTSEIRAYANVFWLSGMCPNRFWRTN